MLTIIGDRINLRQIQRGDARWLVRAMSRGSWWRWDAPWEGAPTPGELRRLPAEVARLAVDRVMPPMRMVIETRRAVPIGTVTRYWADERTNWLEVGVGIYTARYWGRGHGSEALALWVDHLFDTMPLRRIGLRTWAGNHRMMRLARRLGFTREARFREAYVAGGRAYDRLAFGLLRREWLRARRAWLRASTPPRVRGTRPW
jgi:RimJ/RimL family protein N-acetyltransferase